MDVLEGLAPSVATILLLAKAKARNPRRVVAPGAAQSGVSVTALQSEGIMILHGVQVLCRTWCRNQCINAPVRWTMIWTENEKDPRVAARGSFV